MEKLNATKHYLHYPKGDYPPILAYGFRLTFMLLAPYMIINLLLWGLFWAGILPLSFLNDPITWHIYELLFGVGTAGIIAFILTALPELFPGTIPLVGKKLALLVSFWVLGRISFWLIDFLPLFLVGILNIIPLIYIIYYAFKPVVLDKTQKHSSLAYNLVIILALEIYFFISLLGFTSHSPQSILNLSLGAFITLIILALRRINIEAINEWLEEKNIDDVLLVKPPRYNLAIFCIAIYSICEFLFPDNSALSWLALAAFAATLGTLSEYKMEDSFILFEPFVLYLSSIILMAAFGYGFIALTYFIDGFGSLNSFRHFLTIGSFGTAFYMVLIIVSYIHSGRHLQSNAYINIGLISLIISTLLRSFVDFYAEFAIEVYIISSFLWIIAFALYFVKFYKFLITPRADGIKG